MLAVLYLQDFYLLVNFILILQVPADNGAEVTEYRLEWGVVEGVMQICYCGPGLGYEVKGLSPATTYFCRVQVICKLQLFQWYNNSACENGNKNVSEEY